MDELPHPTWSGTFRVFGIELKCHVLSDGQRIIEADSVEQLLAVMADPSDADADDTETEAFARWQRGMNASN
jgi:hypothetical protein